MGEIADLMLEGCLCQVCGEDMGEGDGFPQTCAACLKDTGDDDAAGFQDLKDRSKARRAGNRETSPEILTREQISFYSNNGGVHLICTHAKVTADFWPGTGRWKIRGGETGFGVFNLVKAMKKKPK